MMFIFLRLFGMGNIKKTYVPSTLSRSDANFQKRMILQSRKAYKRKQYITRKQLTSFRSKPSKHVQTAKRMYGVSHIGATKELAKKSGCSLSALKQIIRKGEGAYYSSGSRPNQTAQSWAIARLASALTSGKAASVDARILKSGCKVGSKGYMSAVNAR